MPCSSSPAADVPSSIRFIITVEPCFTASALVNRVLGRVPESEADLSENMTRWEDNANTSAWYYLAVQEATNSHDYELKADGIHEKWVSIKPNPDWTEFEK